MQNLKTVLIDLSGTLHIESSAIPGAVEALKRLRETRLKVKFVTNTTKESKRFLWERLTSIGFELQPDEIFTSLTGARDLIVRRNLRPLLLVEDAALEDFEGISTENPNCVVVGLAPSKFNYNTLNDAFNILLGDASLIAIHKGRYYRRSDGLALGPGPFVSALEYATDKKAEVVGKPESSFFVSGLSSSNPEEAVMIGDDVKDDVAGAQNAGIRGILVRTGKYRPGDENKINPPPNFVFDSFPQAVDYIVDNI